MKTLLTILLLTISSSLFPQKLIPDGIYENTIIERIMVYGDSVEIIIHSEIKVHFNKAFINHFYMIEDSYIIKDFGYVDLSEAEYQHQGLRSYVIRDNVTGIIKGYMLHKPDDNFILEVFEGQDYDVTKYPDIGGLYYKFVKN
jgi:hypothetical protein